MKTSRILLIAFLTCTLFCMNALAFTPESVEAGVEPKASAENAALNEVTSELLFYQDFDALPVGIYQSGEIASMLGESTAGKLVDYGEQGWGQLGKGCTFEICEEENGNRYLKVSGSTYRAFGVWFADDSLHYAVASFNYKYSNANTYKTLNAVAYVQKGEVYAGGNSNGGVGNWSASAAVTSAANTSWTQAYTHSYVQSPCLGLGFNQSSGDGVIYLDDLAVWSFSTKIDDASEPAHKSAVAKTISFQNSAGFADVAMPEDITRYAWYNIYNGQWVSVTVNLASFTPVNAPVGYEFAGWATSDGGTRVKDCHYTNFKVPGNFTFYALWKKAKPTVLSENFDSYDVGTVLTNDDLAFLQLNQFGSADFTATVVLDETTGSKVLKIAGSNIYSGFALKNRGASAEKEYVTFDYRFENTDGSRFVVYAGADHTGGNHKGTLTRSTDWTNFIFGSSSSNKVFGFFFDRNDGNYVLYLDNVTYWYLPAGLDDADKQVTIRFADSTGGVRPQKATLPNAVTKSLWENVDSTENTLYLPSFTPTDVTPGYQFVGWSRTDGGKVIATNYGAYRALKDETLYAVWADLREPITTSETAVHTSAPVGIRFKANAYNLILTADNVEIGLLVARENDATLSLLNEFCDGKLCLEALDLGVAVNGQAYVKIDGMLVGKSYMRETGDGILSEFTACMIGIPEAYYAENILVRSYIVLDNTAYYGSVKTESLYNAAKSCPDKENETVKKIIAAVEG